MKINTSIAPVCNDHRLGTAKHHHVISIALLFVIGILWTACSVAYAADTATTSATAAVKWHPGHYYTLMGKGMDKGKNNPKYMAQIYRELKKTPLLRGIQIRYEWIELEPEENVYDFTSIEQHLTELAAQKKRLIILLQTKTFDPQIAFVPDYLKNTKYENAIFPFSTYGQTAIRGYNLKFWNPLVQDRIAALISALGKRFNAHPYFEGIGLTETAFGKPMVEISKNQLDNYYSGLLNINQQLRKSFPNTMTFQFTNYPNSILKSFISKLKDMGTGLGGPDVLIDEPGLLINESNSPRRNSPRGVYSYYPELSGIVPLTPSVMQPNYVNTRHDNTGRTPTAAELLAFARDRLKANYIFWTRAPGYFPNVLEMLNGLQTGDPAGGLNSACPKVYPSCVD